MTGEDKWLYLDSWQGSIASDGTFETGGKELNLPILVERGLVIIRLKDDAGNEKSKSMKKRMTLRL